MFDEKNDTIMIDFNSFNLNNLDQNENDFLVNLTQNNKEISIKSDKNIENPKISSDDYVYSLSFKIDSFDDDKELAKFIKKIKQNIRSSYEYKLWVDYIKNVLMCNNCVFTGETSFELTIELHHHPIPIYDIILGVIKKKINNNETFSSFDISSEVMMLHYNMRVGCVPLITSLHEKYHNGFLEIPIDFCIGDWKYLIDNYPFDENQMNDINRKISITSTNYKYIWKKNLIENKEKE